MASEPATSSDGDRPVTGAGPARGVTGLTGEAAFSARLGRRATPVVRTPINASRAHQPGRLAGSFGAFNSRLGLSQTSRWTLDAATTTTGDDIDHVRPPINYWPWDDQELATSHVEEAPPRPRAPVVDEPDTFVVSGDDKVDALRRLLSKGKQPRQSAVRTSAQTAGPVSRPAPRPRGAVRRGLPQVLNRKGTTLRRAQPGDIARRLQPAAVDPRSMAARPANGSLPANLPAAAAQARTVETAERSAAAAATRQGSNTPPARAAERNGVDRTPAPAAPAAKPQDTGGSGGLAPAAPVPPWIAARNASAAAADSGGAQQVRRAVDLAGAARDQQRSQPAGAPAEAQRAPAAPSRAPGPATGSRDTPAPPMPSAAVGPRTNRHDTAVAAEPAAPSQAPAAGAVTSPAASSQVAPPAAPGARHTTADAQASPPAAPSGRHTIADSLQGASARRSADAAPDRARAATPGPVAPAGSASPTARSAGDPGPTPSTDAGARSTSARSVTDHGPAPARDVAGPVDRTSAAPSTPGNAAAGVLRRTPALPSTFGDTMPRTSPAVDRPGTMPLDTAGPTTTAGRPGAPIMSSESPWRPTASAADPSRPPLPGNAPASASLVDGTPRPPAANAGATPAVADGPATLRRDVVADGAREAPQPAASPGAPNRPARDRPDRRAPAPAGDATVHRLADHNAAGRASTAPSGSITGPKSPPTHAGPNLEPGRGVTAASAGDRSTSAPAAGLIRRASSDRADPQRAASSPSAWPTQPAAGTASTGVELGARTRAPAASASDAALVEGTLRRSRNLDADAGQGGHTVERPRGLDADVAPAPPLTPRLRAVDDRPGAETSADSPLTSRYRPTWQGDPVVATDRPAARESGPASPAAGVPGSTTRDVQRSSPAGGPLGYTARPAPDAGHPAQSARDVQRTSAVPMTPTTAPATGTAVPGTVRGREATPIDRLPATGLAATSSTTEPSVLRRAPLDDATVRPALAPSPTAPAATGTADTAASPATAARVADGPAVSRAPDARSTNPASPASAARVDVRPASPASFTDAPPATPRATAATATSPTAPDLTPRPPAPPAGRTAVPTSAPEVPRPDAPASAAASDVVQRATAAPATQQPGVTRRDTAPPSAPRPDVARRDTPAAVTETAHGHTAAPTTQHPTTQHPTAQPPAPLPRQDAPIAARTASTMPDVQRAVASPDGASAVPSRPAPPTVRRTEAGDDEGASGVNAAPEHRFESILRRAPAAPAPLPVQWRPLASAIAGERRVRLSTNAASRAALHAAGKRAATTGDVIHLAQPLRGPADAPLFAHELTHVAAPSPAPRFFDDHRDSPEERRAEMIADVIRRSPVLPRPAAAATSAGLPVAPRAYRSPTAPGTSGAPPSTTADDLVRRLSSGGNGSGSGGRDTIRRRIDRVPPPTAAPSSRNRSSSPANATPSGAAPAQPGTPAAQPVEGSNTNPAPDAATATNGSTGEGSTQRLTRAWPMMTDGLDSSSLRDLADWIIEQVEERVVRELERRGGRYRGEF